MRLPRFGLVVAVWAALALLATSTGFDRDEAANVQAGTLWAGGATLYDDAPAHHPPGYPALVAALAWLPGGPLLWPRIASVAMIGAVAWMGRDLLVRSDRQRQGDWFAALLLLNPYLIIAGAQASNEVPVMALLGTAAYLVVRFPEARAWKVGLTVGALLAAAFFVRYSAAFLAVGFLALPWRRLRWVVAGGLVATALGVALAAVAPSMDFAGWWEQTVSFHADRADEGLLAKAVAIGVMAAPLAMAWRASPQGRHVAMFVAGGAAVMALLAAVHLDYFLPLMPLFAWFAAEAVCKGARGRRRQIVVAAWFVWGGAVTAGFVASGQWNDLGAARADGNQIADWLGNGTLLADDPHFALFAGMPNQGGYFWTLDGDGLTAAEIQDEVDLLVLADAHADRWPNALRATHDSWDCARLSAATAWWNPAAGAAPAAFGRCEDQT